MNILIVKSATINEGKFYIQKRKEQEGNLQNKKGVGSGLDIKEGYKNYSRTEQKKSMNTFDIPIGLDPGQMVMCDAEKGNCGGPVIKKIQRNLKN